MGGSCTSSMAHLFVGVGALNGVGPEERLFRFVISGARDGGASVPASQLLACSDRAVQRFDVEGWEQWSERPGDFKRRRLASPGLGFCEGAEKGMEPGAFGEQPRRADAA